MLYGINASTDRLHTFSGVDGTDLGSIQLNGNFGVLGLDLHRGQGTLYACGVQGQMRSLFAVDVESGDVTLVAPDVVDGPCDNLAAPFGPVACVP